MSMNELITVEYAGPASAQVGTLPQYDVRAWWRAVDDGTIGRVKLAAGREVKRHVEAAHVEFVRMDMSTYDTPHMDAMVTFRVLTREQFADRARLRALVVNACALCASPAPTNYLRMPDRSEQAVCFTCLRGPGLAGVQYTTIAWVKANGRLNV